MTTFDKRERSEETKFAHDEEIAFRVRARRNKLVAHWAAEKLGRTDADAYTMELIEADMREPGDEDVIEKLIADFKAAGVDVSEHTIRVEMERLLEEARAQVIKE